MCVRTAVHAVVRSRDALVRIAAGVDPLCGREQRGTLALGALESDQAECGQQAGTQCAVEHAFIGAIGTNETCDVLDALVNVELPHFMRCRSCRTPCPPVEGLYKTNRAKQRVQFCDFEEVWIGDLRIAHQSVEESVPFFIDFCIAQPVPLSLCFSMFVGCRHQYSK